MSPPKLSALGYKKFHNEILKFLARGPLKDSSSEGKKSGKQNYKMLREDIRNKDNWWTVDQIRDQLKQRECSTSTNTLNSTLNALKQIGEVEDEEEKVWEHGTQVRRFWRITPVGRDYLKGAVEQILEDKGKYYLQVMLEEKGHCKKCEKRPSCYEDTLAQLRAMLHLGEESLPKLREIFQSPTAPLTEIPEIVHFRDWIIMRYLYIRILPRLSRYKPLVAKMERVFKELAVKKISTGVLNWFLNYIDEPGDIDTQILFPEFFEE